MTTSVTDDRLTAVARAIWNIRREDEDRCDMELEDMGADHSVWNEAKAALVIAEGWRPIETAPEGVPVIVGWIDEDGDQSDFDIYDEDCWQEHENRRDYFLSVAPPGSRGPKEKAPYTHWMPLPPVPTNDLTAIIGEGD